MPICKRDGFDNAPSKNKDERFQDNEEVFFCEVTKEIFREYEDYFRHVMAINSTVWQCEATGKDNLTYAEALKSEKRARKKMETFKDILRPPVMMVIEHAKQSSLNALNAITCRFLRKRFFLNEEVQITEPNKTKYLPHKVLEILSADKKVPDNGVYEDTDKLLYKLKGLGKTQTETTVAFEKIRRQRSEFTSENLQMFIKSNVIRVDGILRPKPESYKKYVTDRKLTFQKIFIGKMPHFTPAKIKKPEEAKKQSTLNNYFGKKEGGETEKTSTKISAQEKAKLEKEKAEKAEAKAQSLKEQMERIKREREEQFAEQMRQRAEKRAKLLEKIEEECDALLNKTDDLERTDQRLMPTYTTVSTLLPGKILGDAFMLREFMHTFVGLMSGIEVFRGNLSFFEMVRSFTVREVAGPLSDIVLILLGTIMDLQREEEEECAVDYLKGNQAIGFWTHKFVRRHFSFRLNELPLDALTVSEVLRLHILSSGANLKNNKWRLMYRNGYTSSEDPGLTLCMQHPHILRALKLYTVYQLPYVDIMRVLKCLMAQILTYSGTINLIEERMEEMANARQELKNLVTLENQRLAKVQKQKHTLTIEFNQQCLEEEVKKDAEKRKALEEKLNKKVAELLALSERDQRKHQQLVNKCHGALFNFLVYLGMDRAYRKYYVFESMPGIFVEHPTDCMDTCLEKPPINNLSELNSSILAKVATLPKTRKDLRSYLLKVYAEEEKKANLAALHNKNKPIVITHVTQEDKENQNQQNGPINGLTNGHINGNKMEVDDDAAAATTTTQPTQYQLYMCTGDPRNCIVHDERNADRQRWAYFYKKEDLDALIESLNPLGCRESELRQQLTTLKDLITEHIVNCPFDLLSVEESRIKKFNSQMMIDTQRKYSNSNFGFPENPDLNEVMYGALVKRILQFESEIYTGDLGRLKVKDMEKWRRDLHNSCYDPQAKLQWGPTKQTANAAAVEEKTKKDDEDNEGSDNEGENNDGDMLLYSARFPYRDPGETLGETLEIDSEDSADEGISLHDSDTLRSYVKQLSSALLQVEQAVEKRFLKEPFGVPVGLKEKENLERKLFLAHNRLLQWEVSLMECTSYSQVFLHLNVLNDCIIWARSTNKSNCMVCRRGSDPDKMLLCDECNGGTHMFCMKPKMKVVPEGNWYCKKCVDRLGLVNEMDKKNKHTQRRKRKFIVEDDSDTSSVTSETKTTRGRASIGSRSKKRLQSSEIEDVLEEDDEDAEQDEDTEEDEVIVGHSLDEIQENEEEEAVEGDDDQEDGKEENENDPIGSNNQSDVDEDESPCNVCSYDGSELSCTRCKDTFHLECINLKRMPRYNFVCANCKTKEGNKKRKSRANDSSSGNDDSDDDEPILKRNRSARPSLRNSLANGEETSTKAGNSRRSIRRTDDLPLNSPVLYELLEKIMKHENAWPFLRPVSQSEVPDYYDIIKNPMDFAKVKSKLNMGSYQINEEVMRDIELVFSNCDDYNIKGNEIYQAGSALEKYVIDWCKELNLPFKPSDMNSED